MPENEITAEVRQHRYEHARECGNTIAARVDWERGDAIPQESDHRAALIGR